MTNRLLICRVILFILLIIGIGLLTVGTWGVLNLKKIDKEYITTKAKIENIKKYRERRHGKTHIHYEVIVSYAANGKLYTENLNTYSSLMEIGDSIQLKYNPQKPSETHATEFEFILYIVLIFCGIIILITGLFIPRLFRRLKIIA